MRNIDKTKILLFVVTSIIKQIFSKKFIKQYWIYQQIGKQIGLFNGIIEPVYHEMVMIG